MATHSSSRAVTTPTTEDHQKNQEGDMYDSPRKDDDMDIRPWWWWDNDPSYSDDWLLPYWVDSMPWPFAWPWGIPPWNNVIRRYHGTRWKELEGVRKWEGRWTLSPKYNLSSLLKCHWKPSWSLLDLACRLDLQDGDGNTMVATFELPGLRKEDVHIEINDQNHLIISGESHLSAEMDSGVDIWEKSCI